MALHNRQRAQLAGAPQRTQVLPQLGHWQRGRRGPAATSSPRSQLGWEGWRSREGFSTGGLMGPQGPVPVPVPPHHLGHYLCHLAGSGCHDSQSGAERAREGQAGGQSAGLILHCRVWAHPETTPTWQPPASLLEVRALCQLCDSGLSSRLKAGGTAPPGAEQSSRGGFCPRRAGAPTPQCLSREGSGCWLEAAPGLHPSVLPGGTLLGGLNVDSG